MEERNNSWNTPYLFNGKELDEETGLYYYGARYYNPRESVFLSVDPLAEMLPGRSPYEYAFSNPVKLIDPTGMLPKDPEDDVEDPPTKKKVTEYKTKNGNQAVIYNTGGLINFRGRSDTDTDGAGDAHKSDKSGQSQTSIQGGGGVFKSAGKNDDVNPEEISYTVLPGREHYKKLKEEGVFLGDVAYSFNVDTDKSTFSIVADIGPTNKLGENSKYANIALGEENASARVGISSNSVITIVFPGSRKYFTDANSQYYTGGKIPNQSQISKLGEKLVKENLPVVMSILNYLYVQPKIKNY
nr:RHS repeat-associated core domain-containing protein [Apibacter sp. HY039]